MAGAPCRNPRPFPILMADADVPIPAASGDRRFEGTPANLSLATSTNKSLYGQMKGKHDRKRPRALVRRRIILASAQIRPSPAWLSETAKESTERGSRLLGSKRSGALSPLQFLLVFGAHILGRKFD